MVRFHLSLTTALRCLTATKPDFLPSFPPQGFSSPTFCTWIVAPVKMAPKRRKLNKEAQQPTELAVDSSGNPLLPQFDRPPASLVTLPEEIQLMIYRYLLPSKELMAPRRSAKSRLRRPWVLRSQLRAWGENRKLAILCVSKTTHRLAASILYGEVSTSSREISGRANSSLRTSTLFGFQSTFRAL